MKNSAKQLYNIKKKNSNISKSKKQKKDLYSFLNNILNLKYK